MAVNSMLRDSIERRLEQQRARFTAINDDFAAFQREQAELGARIARESRDDGTLPPEHHAAILRFIERAAEFERIRNEPVHDTDIEQWEEQITYHENEINFINQADQQSADEHFGYGSASESSVSPTEFSCRRNAQRSDPYLCRSDGESDNPYTE